MTSRLFTLVPALLMAGCATFTPDPVSLPVTPAEHWQQAAG
ncbi:MAG: hypothetical protein R6T87_05045 [Marinobacter sp.]